MKRKEQAQFDPKSFLTRVGQGRTISDYRKNQTVFSQGDPADALFYIQKGKVRVTVVAKNGKEATIAILNPGDVGAFALDRT